MVQRIQLSGFGDEVDDSFCASGQHGWPGVHQHQSGEAVTVVEGIVECVKPAHGMAYKHQLIESELFNESFNIATMSIAAIVSVCSPGALAMSALIQRMTVKLLT